MKKKRFWICLLLCVMLLAGSFPISVNAAGKVAPTRDTKTDDTNMFVMGDCRVKFIFHSCKLPGAAIAQGAGHYRGLWPNGYVIDTNRQMALMKKSVINNLKKNGKATVIIMATINIGSAARSKCDRAVRAQLRPAKTATGWSATYKGKKVKPTVIVTSLVPKNGVSPANYNNCLKKYLKTKKYRSIKYITVSAKGGYTSDGYHLRRNGAKAIWNSMHAADGHSWKETINKRATFTANGKATQKCRICGKTRTITVPYIKTCQLANNSFIYTGKAFKPAVTIKDSKGNAISKSYYSMSYSNNTDIGTGTVKVVFKRRYSGTKTLNFQIEKPEDDCI